MRLLFILPLFALNVCFAQKNDFLFLDAAITKLQNSKAYTLKVANLMPDEKYEFKPVPGEMSFGEQLVHLAENLNWLTSTYITSNKSPETKMVIPNQKKEQILKVISKTYDIAIEALKSFNLLQLADTVSFFAGTKTKLQIINLINDHQTHHRAQMIVYLRLNGIKPPDYIGW